jgi:hypothetical protein
VEHGAQRVRSVFFFCLVSAEGFPLRAAGKSVQLRKLKVLEKLASPEAAVLLYHI